MKKRASRAAPPRSAKDPSPYPKGWNRQRTQALIDYYDHQSDDDAVAEAEAAYQNNTTTMMAVPVELVPKVQKLIAKRAG